MSVCRSSKDASKLAGLVLVVASTTSAFQVDSTSGLHPGRARWAKAHQSKGWHPGLSSEPGNNGFGGDMNPDDWFDQALAAAGDGDNAFAANFFDEPQGGFDDDGPARSADDWFDMALGGADADPFEVAAAAAAAAERQAAEAAQRTGGGEVSDDEYARMMGANHVDAADSAVWGAEANAMWAGQATDGRGLRLPTVGIDLVKIRGHAKREQRRTQSDYHGCRGVEYKTITFSSYFSHCICIVWGYRAPPTAYVPYG